MDGVSKVSSGVALPYGEICRFLLFLPLLVLPLVSAQAYGKSGSQTVDGRFDLRGRIDGTDTQLPVCNLTVNSSDARTFARDCIRRKASFVFFTLKFESNISVIEKHNLFYPYSWIWTSNSSNGSFPFLSFDYDFIHLSLGLLKHYVLDVQLTLKAEEDNCSLQLGKHSTTLAIAKALGRMVKQNLPPTNGWNASVFCYKKHTRLQPSEKALYHFLTYFGYWKDLTIYSCCRFKKKDMDIACDISEIPLSAWSTFIYFIGLLCFMYVPIPLSKFGDYVLVPHGTVDSSDFLHPSDFDNEETPLLRKANRSRIRSYQRMASRGDNWIFLGVHKPVTWSSLLGTPLRCVRQRFPVLISRLCKMFIFSVLIPLPIYVKIIYYTLSAQSTITERIRVKIPVGFLSLPYGFSASHSNWLTHFGGPMVVLGIYFTVGQFCICIPKNLSACFVSVLKREGRYQMTLLSLDTKLVERFGAVNLEGKSSHNLVSSLLLGNLFTLINPSFWGFVYQFCCKRFQRCIRALNLPLVISCALGLLYFLFCVIEIALCVVYYGCPTIFHLINLIRAFLIYYAPHGSCRALISPFIITCLLANYYAFFLLFIRGIFFILLVFYYTYAGIILYPNITLGYVIGIGTMLIYLVRSSLKLSDSYMAMFYEIVKINLALEKETKEKGTVVKGKSLVVKNVDAAAIENLAIGEVSINFTKEQRQLLSLAPTLLDTDRKKESMYIRWRGASPGIPSELFRYVAEKHRPLRRSVFVYLVELSAFTVLVAAAVNLIVSFNQLHNFTVSSQVLTGAVLTVLPKLNDILTTEAERAVKQELLTNKLKMTVKKFYSIKERENEFQVF
ncbi:uncharacterized protein LOC135467523 [Liolophura sinensis]|uniref:uncharacterized protein LOC135467523 n=1 Tax=Liolophura sinensis TaxID=3198878 RepID=UPI0031589C63